MAVILDRIGWENGINGENPSGKTPISAENLKQMENNTENGINEVDARVDQTNTELENVKSTKGILVRLASQTGTSFTDVTVRNLRDFSAIILQCGIAGNNSTILASSVGEISQFIASTSSNPWRAVYAAEPANYDARAYYVNDTTIKVRSASSYDRVLVYGILK